MKTLSDDEYDALVLAVAERDRLLALINTPELVDFPKAVHLEAVHQEARWGTEDRRGKDPADWYRLVTHLSTRALEHHKEAERMERLVAEFKGSGGAEENVALFREQIAYHREKATHHCITTAAALDHWHANVLRRFTTMRAGYAGDVEIFADRSRV